MLLAWVAEHSLLEQVSLLACVAVYIAYIAYSLLAWVAVAV